MKIVFILSMFLVLVTACQKEIDWGLAGEQNKLLVRIGSKTGNDSSTVFYNYNTAKLLIGEKTVGLSGTTSIDNDLKIYRLSSGVIERTVLTSVTLAASGVDSIVTRYNYNTTTSKYTSAVFSVNIMGLDITDSTLFTYDGSGRISMDEHYTRVTGFPLPLLTLRNTYTYSADGLNLVSVQQSAPQTIGGPLSQVSTQTFTYDTKKSPLALKNEAILILRPNLYSAQNSTKTTLVNTIDPTADFNLDVTYRYNTASKPDSSFSTRTPGGEQTTSKYFYQ
jgi:hypothetical protein